MAKGTAELGAPRSKVAKDAGGSGGTGGRKGSRDAPASMNVAKGDLPVVTPESLSEFNDTWNILIYGDSGSWKTGLAGGAPRALFISTEKGTIAAQRLGSTAQVIKAYDWLAVEAALNYVDDHPGEFDVIIIDSLTKMQILMLRWILGVINEQNPGRDIDIPAIQDHQKWQNMFKRFVDRIIDMDVHTIFICTAMRREDEDSEDIVLPQLLGKDYEISSYVCAQVDMLLFLKALKVEPDEPAVHRLLAEAYPPYWAKDRFHALPRWLDIDEGEVDVMARIIASIEGSEEWEKRSKERKSKARKTGKKKN